MEQKIPSKFYIELSWIPKIEFCVSIRLLHVSISELSSVYINVSVEVIIMFSVGKCQLYLYCKLSFITTLLFVCFCLFVVLLLFKELLEK